MNQHKAKAVRRQVRKAQSEIIRQFFVVTLDMPLRDRAEIAIDILSKGKRRRALLLAFLFVAACSAAGAVLALVL